jgi:hypothetical protein
VAAREESHGDDRHGYHGELIRYVVEEKGYELRTANPANYNISRGNIGKRKHTSKLFSRKANVCFNFNSPV